MPRKWIKSSLDNTKDRSPKALALILIHELGHAANYVKPGSSTITTDGASNSYLRGLSRKNSDRVKDARSEVLSEVIKNNK